MITEQNCSMLCDFYQLTMGNGYFKTKHAGRVAYFDVFFRRIPDGGGYAVCAGLEQVIGYIENLHFDDDDIEFLRKKGIFDEGFLSYLRGFRFEGDIYAVPEGTPVFPYEPLITVRAPAIQAQFVETMMLLLVNHQSLIATKASRIVRAAQGRAISEFGSRRAQGASGAVLGARAAYIGGCAGSACVIADKLYGVPASGTMAHSWVQMFDCELEAFEEYCRIYPTSSTLLVDTYDVLRSGVPNAIKAFDNILKPLGARPSGIRLDSGDIAYLSIQARKMLDEAGYPDCKIIASNSLDERLISNLLAQGAKIDAFGVGERLITASSEPVFGGVYKLAATEENGVITPKIKISENVVKITNPHFKKVYRLYDNATGKALADLLCVHDEVIDSAKPLEIFDPDFTWKRKTLTDFTAKELQVPVFLGGKRVYCPPPIDEVRRHCAEGLSTLWESVLRFENPHRYYVDLSQKLWDIKHSLLDSRGGAK